MNRLTYLSGLTLFAIAAACGDDAPSNPSDDTKMDSGLPSDNEPGEDSGIIPDAHAIPDGGNPGEIMCAELGSLCHSFDRGDGELGDRCHDVGHAGNPDECAEIYDECIAFCHADAGDGHSHDAGPQDGGRDADPGDGGHDAGKNPNHGDGGSAQCEELGHLCHDFDTSEGLGHECHEVGHSGDAAECANIYDECIAFCQGDAGHDHNP